MLKLTQTQDPGLSREQLRTQIQNAVKDAQIAAEKAAQARAQAEAGRVTTSDRTFPTISVPPYPNNDIPPQVQPIAISFFVVIGAIIIGLPIMRAFARRIDRGSVAPPAISNEVRAQLQQISASVDAIAIEVERISEGQRFTTKMLADRTREGTVVTPSREP
jgi:hypothetical protein